MAKKDIAMQVLQQVVKLPVVKVDREKFLVEKFSKELGHKNLNKLIEQGPATMLPKATLDRVAKACINENVLLASGASILAGLPGGIAMAITIPTDVAQFYGFSLKLAQEIGYIYGFDDLWSSREELSEEAQKTLLLYLGVMLGVDGAGALLRFSGVIVTKKMINVVNKKAFTKTIWYPVLEKVLKVFGVNLTKGGLTKGGLTKGLGIVVPILGGLISGGLTFATMKTMGERLQKELSKLVNYSEVQYQEDVETIRKEVEIIEGE